MPSSSRSSGRAQRNYGGDFTLRARQGTVANPVTYVSYLRFALPPLGAVRSASLRLYAEASTRHGGVIYGTSDAWSESAITWANAPAPSGDPIATIGRVPTAGWIDVPLRASAFTPGRVSYGFVLRSEDAGAASALYSSREGANPPQLVLETG